MSRTTRARSRAQKTEGPTGGALGELLQQLIAESSAGQYDRAHLDTEVVHQGKQIILPGEPTPMPIPQAIDVLQSMHEENEQEVAINEVIRGVHYSDALVAFAKAMEEVFGWTKATTVRTFFGDQHPEFVDIPIGLDENGKEVSHRVITGRFTMPNVPGYVQTNPTFENGLWCLQLRGETVRKFQFLFAELADATRRIAAEESIYRNKAIELRFDDDGHVSSEPPRFIDLRGHETPIFSRQTEMAIKANILTIIEQTERCRQMGVPIKRGILLEGPYGTGKTLVSRQTGQIATGTGTWTFMVIRKAENVAAAIEFARRFSPCVLFVEDIDRSASGEKRTVELDKILNTMDGVDSKNADIMVVFTSNHADTINKAMLRPGRLDAVITIDAPDSEAALRLAQNYAGDLWDEKADYQPVGESLAGKSAAVIREVVERAKLYAIGEVGEDEDFKLTPSALGDSAATMDRQLALLDPDPVDETPVGELFIQEISDRVSKVISGGELLEDIQEDVERTKDLAGRAASTAGENLELAQKAAAGSSRTDERVKEIHEEVVP